MDVACQVLMRYNLSHFLFFLLASCGACSGDPSQEGKRLFEFDLCSYYLLVLDLLEVHVF